MVGLYEGVLNSTFVLSPHLSVYLSVYVTAVDCVKMLMLLSTNAAPRSREMHDAPYHPHFSRPLQIATRAVRSLPLATPLVNFTAKRRPSSYI